MQKWEYKIILGTLETYRELNGERSLAYVPGRKEPDMTFKNITKGTFEDLNTLGADGWEVCGVTSYDGYSREIYLKRQK